ncbi:4'-phosphopantetheinyl transferase superfamily protein [Hymenobacter sp. YC55]|uniref:4'-phosphopantetheinyl transferase family protein n=1 Tax=Hymenobacter sp. YC55 TaxID=3034019 RepID=UPI0023F8116C|nr:4'-phosphopantetheinyl transferase superfamily protein [Hymenobacter sp. YC55]MDF7810788.1 4'-phosphopantetheinyl transferase superfamily protein [Hymenobacter sp. YC55]
MLLAIAPDDIGVDVECVRHDFHFQDVVDFSFSPKEKNFIKESADPTKAFYTLWTRKEALVKATAQGINDDFNYIPSLNGSHLIDQAKLITSLDWTTSSFPIGTDCIGAISYPFALNSKDFAFYTVDTIPSALYAPSNQLVINTI